MEGLNCTCGATGFRTPGALGSHRSNFRCGSKRPRRNQIIGNTSDKLPAPAAPAPAYERALVVEPAPVLVNEPAPVLVNEPAPAPVFESPKDDPDSAIFQDDDSKVPFDSTFSLVQWIRTCRNNGGLSVRDINVLFNEVLFHPSFKLEDVSVRSAADLESYEGEFVTAAGGHKHKQEHI